MNKASATALHLYIVYAGSEERWVNVQICPSFVVKSTLPWFFLQSPLEHHKLKQVSSETWNFCANKKWLLSPFYLGLAVERLL